MPFFGVPIRNGLPIGLGSVAGFGVQQFDPSQLFEGGTVAGAWYDPSDLSTMFDTSAGTTPVAMPGQGAAVPVGLMLDKSQGLVLGSELVTNGDFSGGTTGWTGINATLAVVNGAVQITADGAGQARASQTISGLTAGRWYEVRAKIWQGTGAVNVDILVTGITQSTAVSTTTPTDAVVRFVAAGATQTIRVGSTGTAVAGTTYFADNISVRELPGNHAISFNNTTARPELRARVNLLTYSEEFDNGAWTKSSVSEVAGKLAPDGTNTAFEITATAANGILRQQLTLTGADYTFSIWLRRVSGTGSIGISAHTGGTIVNVTLTSSWQRFDVTQTLTAGVRLPGVRISTSGDVIEVWGADLRPANIGANVPAYQRIADALTYDTNGFPLYLRFDGSDDSMYTPANLNLSGTDKVTVFAGVRKLVDATGTIAELSASVSANNGAFACFAPQGTAVPGYFFRSKGTLTGTAEVLTGYAAPITNVFTGIGDISGDSALLRLNGAQVASDSANQGTGNYGTYPLFIGARNNGSLWLNGQLYSLIIAGSAVSAGNISATEQWVAGKTGIQI